MTRARFVFAVAIAFWASFAQAEIPRFREVAEGIYRGGQPENALDYDYLESLGVQTILNLRMDKTVPIEREIAERRDIGFVNVPMSGFFAPTNKKVRKALEVLSDPSRHPVFVHCRHGKDRTGLIVGLYRIREQDWDKRTTYREMLEIGFNPWLIGLEIYYWTHAGRVPHAPLNLAVSLAEVRLGSAGPE